jgi:hypothetical protein
MKTLKNLWHLTVGNALAFALIAVTAPAAVVSTGFRQEWKAGVGYMLGDVGKSFSRLLSGR